ncbi:hypothetical protein O4H61_12465 [Roseovarius aestuarii]|nr:hypothetical protein [Roseovarius aestuarii]
MRAQLAIAIAILPWTVFTACAPFPQLDNTVSDTLRDAPYPQLVPLDALDTQMAQPRLTDQSMTAMEARIQRLRTRASRLRGTVIDSPTRQRMSRGVN